MWEHRHEQGRGAGGIVQSPQLFPPWPCVCVGASSRSSPPPWRRAWRRCARCSSLRRPSRIRRVRDAQAKPKSIEIPLRIGEARRSSERAKCCGAGSPRHWSPSARRRRRRTLRWCASTSLPTSARSRPPSRGWVSDTPSSGSKIRRRRKSLVARRRHANGLRTSTRSTASRPRSRSTAAAAAAGPAADAQNVGDDDDDDDGAAVRPSCSSWRRRVR